MNENRYMQQVQQAAENVKQELQVKRMVANVDLEQSECQDERAAAPARARRATAPEAPSHPLGVRVTGFWRFKTVVVPPNMYVVHTRRGHAEPLHVGLGVSFRFDPELDSYLVVPSALQTILINANSICRELQGILIQAYVQWIIADIGVAYKRLDFSDLADPMRVVNVQLREQAEAAIKDKVATLSINEVLSDKRPIIEELTKRLKEAAEGSGDDRGLGIRIVTVQIKEAVVSSATVWENLQKPYRAAQATAARLAELEHLSKVAERELVERKARETATIATEAELALLRAERQSEQVDRERVERVRREQLEQEAEQKRIEAAEVTARAKAGSDEALRENDLALEHQMAARQAALAVERCKLEQTELAARTALEAAQAEAAWERKRSDLAESSAHEADALAAELERAVKRNLAANEQRLRELDAEERSRLIANNLSPEAVQLRAVEVLPALAKALPTPQTLHSVALGDQGAASLPGLLASLTAVLRSFGVTLGGGAVPPPPQA